MSNFVQLYIASKVPVAPVSINEAEQNSFAIAVYPNPLQHTAFINVTNGISHQFAHINLYNVTGALIKEVTIPISSGTYKLMLPLPSLAKGLYLLNVQIGYNTLEHKIFIDQ